MRFFQRIFKKSPPPKGERDFAWLENVNSMDDVSAIEYATQQLNVVTKNIFINAQSTDSQYLLALLLADEKIHIIVKRITAHYVNFEHIGAELNERITNAVFLYHRQTFLTYVAIIEKLALLEPLLLTTTLARAINNATQMIKWRYFNYQSAPANVWLQLSKLLIITEKKSLLGTKIKGYSDPNNADQLSPSLSSAYIHAFMLGSLESLSFKPQQIELVSKILAQWSEKIMIENIYDEKKHQFQIDIARDLPAKRIRNFKPADHYRYWCFDTINADVGLCISLIELNISSKQQMIKEVISSKYALTTLEALQTEWSRDNYKRQRRNEERIQVMKPASTAYGFKNTCDQIKQYNNIEAQHLEKFHLSDQSLEMQFSSRYAVKSSAEPNNVIYTDFGAERSNVIDESSKGLGLQISKKTSEVSLGMMVGVSSKALKYNTKIGVIRGIKPITSIELRIGVEVLSNTSFRVGVKNTNLNAARHVSTNQFIDKQRSNTVNAFNLDFEDSSNHFTCLLLPQQLATSKPETLIFPIIQYNIDDIFLLKITDADVPIKLTGALEQYDNWVRVTFSKNVK